ncbi:hypothetical protein GCM10008995_20610 [Halobellus salinus]|uniref:Uncharacterized protein n=1 Tax=Halobellus salinus TaxID=931585 RepID=A0A830EUB2_9EURY|nr:hypothetical protein [Halobellus salinus]GGJ10648.1 hypothetical protein GCM10008995_20610 [Halobellus salinus]SMP10082.1 hypothetical protein SAMN06265347_103159 [Halobellus salinus]
MDLDSFTPRLGAAACLLLAGVVFVPAAFVSAPGNAVAAYYASGPLGVSIVGVLALVNIVVFLAGAQGRSDPQTLAGVAAVSGVSMVLFAVLWAVSIDPTVIFSFPSEYAWIESHRWVVVAGAALATLAAGGYAMSTLP